MGKKNLLIASDCFLPRWDGIARFLLEIIPYLTRYYNVTVMAPKFEGKMRRIPKIRLVRFRLGIITLGDYRAAVPNKKTIIQEVKKADIIFTQTIGPIGKNTIEIAKKHKKKVVAYTHSIEWELVPHSAGYITLKSLFNKIALRIAKRLYGKCDLLMVPSLEISELLGWQGIRTKKVIVPLGTNTEEFVPPRDKAKAKELIKINPKDTVIGFSGRLGREKDIPTLYRAFRRLEKKYSNLSLLVVGKGVSELKRMLKRRKNIMLVEFTNNIVPYLQAMDIYVLPSLTETTSISTLEAMSCGLPVIVTPVGSLPGYIQNNYNGIFFPKRDPYRLEKKLSRLINNPGLRKTIGDNARKTVKEKFSWENTFKEMKKVFESL